MVIILKKKKSNALIWAMKMTVRITGKNWKKLDKKEKQDIIELSGNYEDQLMFENDKIKIWAMEKASKIIGRCWDDLSDREQKSVIIVASNLKDKKLF